MINALVTAGGIYAGTFAVAAISSVVPIVSIEVFLVAIAIAHPGPAASALVVLAAAGQVVGKLPVFFAVRGLAAAPGRHRARLERARAWVARAGKRPHALLAVSAVFGLPPFSLASTAAGALGIRASAFCAIVALGRAARFAVLVAVAGAFA